MTAPSRRLAALFLLALLGVLVLVGIVVGELAGAAVAGGYAVVVFVLLLAGAVRSRRSSARDAPARSCACCTGDHTAPVEVV